MILTKLLLILMLLKNAQPVEPIAPVIGIGITWTIGEGLAWAGSIGFGSFLIGSIIHENARDTNRYPPGHNEDWTKARGETAWIDPEGNKWSEDKKHKDTIPHWDVSDRKGKKIKEVDKDGKKIWPDGNKNKGKKP